MVVDEEIRDTLDSHLLTWEDVTSRRMFGGNAYMVGGKMFCMLMDGLVGMKLPDPVRADALTLAGVSPFTSPSGGTFGQWVQFVVPLEDNVPPIIPWLQAALAYVVSLPSSKRRSRGGTSG